MPEGFSLFIHPQWDGAVEIRGIDGSVQRMRPGRGRPHASYALEWEGRNTIWLNELFRGFAVYNVLAGKVAIG